MLIFLPDGMSFEEYFRFEGCDEEEMAMRFLLGLSPAMLQLGYLADPDKVTLAGEEGPVNDRSVSDLCWRDRDRGIEDPARTRGRALGPIGLSVRCLQAQARADLAPGRQSESDPAHRLVVRSTAVAEDEREGRAPWFNRDTLVRILELGRWAPSGDNTQPWRFEIAEDGLIRIHGFDTRDEVVY